MNALITGSAGFVGSHLVDLYIEKGYTVSVLLRKESNLRWLEGKNIEKCFGSYSDVDFLQSVVKNKDIIVHSAGVLASLSYDGFYKGNVLVTKQLLDAIKEVNANLQRFVHISSLAVAQPSPNVDFPTNEDDDLLEPLTRYGKSKLEAEYLVRTYSKYFPITIIRPPSVYGPRDEAIYGYLRLISNGFIAPIMGFDSKVLSLIHVSDLVRGIYIASTTLKAISKTYYITSKQYYTWNDIISATQKAVDKKLIIRVPLPNILITIIGYVSEFIGRLQKNPSIFDREKAKNFTQRHWICSHKKAVEELQFQQEISLEAGMQETIEWYKKNRWM